MAETNPYAERLRKASSMIATCQRAMNVPANNDPVVATLVEAVALLAEIVAELAGAAEPKQTLLEESVTPP